MPVVGRSARCHVLGASIFGEVGFTISIFISNLAYTGNVHPRRVTGDKLPRLLRLTFFGSPPCHGHSSRHGAIE
ncbi:Na+/H+ antiporter NhaA [Nitrospira lenta]|uniref:Na+/H+ antiporter NhaA n=1 Tax=Nitrospira lenta TaxID=1436998 RepID=UPI000EFCF5A5